MVAIRPFEPDESSLKKLADYLMFGFLCVEDTRTPESIANMVLRAFPDGKVKPEDEWYAIWDDGELCGLVGFFNIEEGHKCAATIKLWNPAPWGIKGLRRGIEIMKDVMARHKLVRIDTETADPRIVKMARLLGFECEGVRPFDFRFDGVLYHKVLLGVCSEVKHG